jgi:hypothetical protein
MSNFASLLEDTQDRVETAQLVLSKVEHGLEVVEKVEAVAKRTRPVLRSVAIATLACLVGLVLLLVIRRRLGEEIEVREGESPEEVPAHLEDGHGSSS